MAGQARQQHIPICDMRSRSKSSYFLKKLHQKRIRSVKSRAGDSEGKETLVLLLRRFVFSNLKHRHYRFCSSMGQAAEEAIHQLSALIDQGTRISFCLFFYSPFVIWFNFFWIDAADAPIKSTFQV